MRNNRTIAEKRKKAWVKVCHEFSNDSMLRDLHFIRELMELGMTSKEIRLFLETQTGETRAFRETIKRIAKHPEHYLPLQERKLRTANLNHRR